MEGRVVVGWWWGDVQTLTDLADDLLVGREHLDDGVEVAPVDVLDLHERERCAARVVDQVYRR